MSAYSQRDEEHRLELVRSRKFFLESDVGGRVARSLRRVRETFVGGYVLSHTPDQDSDFYVVLDSDGLILSFEFSRVPAAVEDLSVLSVDQYKRLKLSSEGLARLRIACDLLQDERVKRGA